MIPEAPFFFSIAGVSASLAGLAGLVAALRRGADMRPLDLYRLREIVEFAFANVLLALSIIPVSPIVGDSVNAVRLVAVAAVGYSIVHFGVLVRRRRLSGLPSSRPWFAVAAVIDTAAIAIVGLTLASGSIEALETLLLVFLARPMGAFLLVLASFE